MKIIISPTKKMRVETDSLPWRDLPLFLDKTEQIYKVLQSTPADELQKIWKCSVKCGSDSEYGFISWFDACGSGI